MSSKKTKFDIKLYRCIGSTSCRSTTEINNFMNDLYFCIVINNWYFNFDNYDNPIKSFIDDIYSYQLSPGFNK